MEEVTNEQQVDQTPSESSTQEQGESQEAQNVESTEEIDQASDDSSESDAHDTPQEEGNDGVDEKEKMPVEGSEKEKAAIRKMHEATQEAAKYRKEAEAFQQLLNHPEFNEFLQWHQQKKQSASQPQQEVPKVELTDEEFLAAQTDPEKFSGLLNSRLQAMLQPVAQQAMQKINNLERELAISKQEREIDAFASKHPDFWEIDHRIMKAAIQETQGKGITAAYDYAKQLEKQYLNKAQSSIQKKVQQKKQASSASPSKSMEPKIVYVDNDMEATRVAFDYASKGKRVDVRVKKKN